MLDLNYIYVGVLLREHGWDVKKVADQLGVHRSTVYDRLKRWHLERPAEMPKGSHNRSKTHCKRGHRFHSKNLAANKRGVRYCRACDVVRKAEAKVKTHGL